MAQANPRDLSMERQLPHKEVRFAVVMYGGVSLAIYIHGVAHELLSLVRSTARDKKSGEYVIPDRELKGAELVYRSLGETLKAKFIVDILSGTSAGGINAVYLAKALVNDRSMDGLKELWVQEGDISKLINDNHSVDGLGGLGLQDPPEALLNSQRMYFKLLEALKRMGSAGDTDLSPYVEQLDLNITATDIRGLNLPIKIHNDSINELRYRTVFKFQYSTGTTFRNDFTKAKDPFLAFAARCTSSIPPAFEAMRLKDIEDVLKTSMFKDDYGDLLASQAEPWQSFYEEYVGTGDAFPVRSFGDGGYLDNKPFSYATETLANRRADLPVDRKLIYIEPSPEHPEMRLSTDKRPNMIENLSAALVGLPRQETIRDDLKNLLQRNENIARTNKILAEVNDVFHKIVSREGAGKSRFQAEFDSWKGTKSDWPGKYLDEVIDDYGAHYPSYHQLRVEDTLDMLSSIFAGGMGWEESGQEAKDLRVLLNAWRDEFYATTTNEAARKPGIHSENEILSRLDLGWRQRRIYFIQTLANVLLDGLDGNNAQAREQAEGLFKLSGVDASDYENCPDQYRLSIQELKEKFNLITAEFDHAINLLSDDRALGSSRAADTGSVASYASRLKELHDALADAPRESAISESNLQRMAGLLESHNPQARSIVLPTLRKIEDLTVDLSPHYEPAIAAAPVVNPDEPPKAYFIKDSLRTLAIESANTLGEEGRGAVKQIAPYFNLMNENIDTGIHTKVQQVLKFFHDRFEYYDMLLFPLQFGANFGESDEVEIIRVSPEDATRFINERETGRKKLAGTKLSNFGAFFRKEWRENDMLWGRLDAAEILLNELLDGESQQRVADLRTALAHRMAAAGYPPSEAASNAPDPYEVAFELILQEDLKPKIEVQLYNLVNGKPAVPPRGAKAVRQGKSETTSPRLEELKSQETRLARLQEDLEGYLLEKEDASLRQRVEQFKTERKVVSEQINSERARLKQPVAAPPDTSQLSKTGMEQYQELSHSIADGPHLLHYFKYGYEVDTSFEPQSTVLVADRFVQTLSRMLNGLSENRSVEKPIRAFTFLMRIVSSVVTFALPKSIANYLFSGYWIWLLYAAEAIIWIAGILTANQGLAGIGWKTVLATGVIHLAVSGLNRWIFPTGTRKYVVTILSSLVVILLALVLGSVFYSGLVYLHILPTPAGVFQNLLLWIQSLFQNKAG